MNAEPLGEAAFVLRDLSAPAYLVADALNEARVPGLFEAVASYDTVGLYVDPEVFQLSFLPGVTALEKKPTRHIIPTCYELGEDLAEASSFLGVTPEQLINHHEGRNYRCYAVGFCPGFGYLGYLPDEIALVPRKQAPRTRIPAGSVAITGRQTAVYPLPTPGGWALIGRTPLTLVDVDDDYFPLRAGDIVRFQRIDEAEFERLRGERL